MPLLQMRQHDLLHEGAVLRRTEAPASRSTLLATATLATATLALTPWGAVAQPSAVEHLLFQPQTPEETMRLGRAVPACRKESYPFAAEVHCFTADPVILEKVIPDLQSQVGPNLRFLPGEFDRPDCALKAGPPARSTLFGRGQAIR